MDEKSVLFRAEFGRELSRMRVGAGFVGLTRWLFVSKGRVCR